MIIYLNADRFIFIRIGRSDFSEAGKEIFE